MVFKVTSADKQAVFGGILFGVPNAENIETAVKTVSESCRKKAGELYGTKEAILRLETELALMRKTDTVFHFLVENILNKFLFDYLFPRMLLLLQ